MIVIWFTICGNNNFINTSFIFTEKKILKSHLQVSLTLKLITDCFFHPWERWMFVIYFLLKESFWLSICVTVTGTHLNEAKLLQTFFYYLFHCHYQIRYVTKQHFWRTRLVGQDISAALQYSITISLCHILPLSKPWQLLWFGLDMR